MRSHCESFNTLRIKADLHFSALNQISQQRGIPLKQKYVHRLDYAPACQSLYFSRLFAGSGVGDSSTVEQRTLTPLVMVRIQVPQPSNFVMSLRIFSVRGRRSDKWTVPVVTLLGDGSKRFNELGRITFC
jgi:hypothetical protein